MGTWLSLTLPATLLALTAAALGWLVGLAVGAGHLGGAVGAGLGVLLALAWTGLRAAVRAERLLRWLRADAAGVAPRDGGLWSELAYRIERALRLRERQLQDERQRLTEFLQAIEASPNGVLLLAEGGRIEWCNAVAALQLGLDPQRDRGQQVTNLVRAPAFVAYLQGGQWREPVSFTRPDGDGTLQVLLRAYGDGQTLLVAQDVTERLRAESMRRDFVANVSHEIRSPLTVLAGFVETMRSLPLSQAERARVLTLMQQQTDRMQQLVSDLLTLAQLEGSPRPGSERWCAVPALVDRVLADAQGLSRGRHTVQRLDGPPLDLAGSDGELLSALGNLASNAVRYTPDGGQITLSWAQRADGCLCLEVSDTGIGIAREHLPRLTERFYRVDGSRSRETGGTGLGLAIVKHVVQRHGGELEVDSTAGEGSRFRLVFPAVRVRAGMGVPTAAASSGAVSLNP